MTSLKKIIFQYSKKTWFLPITVLSLLGLLLLCVAIFMSSSLPEPNRDIFAGRNFNYSPFELTDAYDICHESIKSKHPRSLLTSYMDDLSTYYDERKKNYRVVIDINVGDSVRSMPGKVYCTVSPANYQLTHYREVIEEQGSIFSRALGVLSRVVEKDK